MTSRRPTALLGLGLAALVTLAAACGGNPSKSPKPESMPGMHMSGSGSMKGSGSMPGMKMGEPVPGNGLLASSDGFTLKPLTPSVSAGHSSPYRFQIVQANGAPLTTYQPEQTKQLHFYLVRDDLTGFQHLHPTMAPDGTWSIDIVPPTAGTYRVFAQFDADAAGKVTSLVLSQPLDVTGGAAGNQPLPAPSGSATVDGYNLTASGGLKAGTDSDLMLNVNKDGKPVTDLQPYLDSYAHLTALHEGDLAFVHLHPSKTVNGDHGGPMLHFMGTFPEPGNYRVFIQFQTNGALHTAAISLAVQ